MNVNEINPAVLAYIGDAIYEVLVRNYLIKNNNTSNVNILQKTAVNYVSAASQSKILEELIKKDIFTEQELYTIKRAKNHKINSKPKHSSVKTYKKATALEALFGMLYINGNYERLKYLFKEIIGE